MWPSAVTTLHPLQLRHWVCVKHLPLKVEWVVGRNKWSGKESKKQTERDKENSELESEKGRSKSRI